MKEQFSVGYNGQTHEVWATDGVHGQWRVGWCNGTREEIQQITQLTARKGWRVVNINKVQKGTNK